MKDRTEREANTSITIDRWAKASVAAAFLPAASHCLLHLYTGQQRPSRHPRGEEAAADGDGDVAAAAVAAAHEGRREARRTVAAKETAAELAAAPAFAAAKDTAAARRPHSLVAQPGAGYLLSELPNGDTTLVRD
ncbi:hypothetical protein B0A48_08324 [Cryoendolithus antarcticus]|uniref:Uncharacterized protein n=1 Tax=Cryoendolithus antarcticus TaxID=1507870 RepID=A0A1V8T5K5_9PEZI|nr:hypothetical protein B0A48_08324 [Cryoendolithus antarcticus]